MTCPYEQGKHSRRSLSFMNRPLSLLVLASAVASPSCIVYDSDLLEQAVGGESDGVGSGSATGGSGQGTGASPGDGDGDLNPSGGVAGDGDDPGTGGNDASGGSSAGGAPGAGGNSGTGGVMVDCGEIGAPGAFTNVSSTQLVDDFEQAWNKLGQGATYTGFWFVARDDDSNDDLTPLVGNWFYESEPCTDTDVLHIVGNGFMTWGVSYDAQLMADVGEVNLSAFTGVAFWARSDASNQIKVAISHTDGGSPSSSPPIFIGDEWEQHLVPFPVEADTTKATVVHLVVVNAPSFDVWIDDLSFYVAP